MLEKNTKIRAAIDAFDISLARNLVREALPNADAETYYLASQVALDDAQKYEFLEKAIALDPFHENANLAIKQRYNPPVVAPASPLIKDPTISSVVSRTIQTDQALTERPRRPGFLGISRSLAIVLIISFFLPWYMSSCAVGGTTEMKGFDIVSYTIQSLPDSTNIPTSLLLISLILIPLAALITLALSFKRSHLVPRADMLTGILGLLLLAFIILVAAQWNISAAIQFLMSGVLLIGFWITVGCLIGLAIVGFIMRRISMRDG